MDLIKTQYPPQGSTKKKGHPAKVKIQIYSVTLDATRHTPLRCMGLRWPPQGMAGVEPQSQSIVYLSLIAGSYDYQNKNYYTNL